MSIEDADTWRMQYRILKAILDVKLSTIEKLWEDLNEQRDIVEQHKKENAVLIDAYNCFQQNK